jgi:hypothetical protein
MIEPLLTALVGTFALGLASWHIARILHQGDLFKPFREWLEYVCARWETGDTSFPATALYHVGKGFKCRLCFGTQVAIVLTWGMLVTGLIVQHSVLPAAEWGFAFAVGPFITGAWAEIIRRVEALEAPE